MSEDRMFHGKGMVSGRAGHSRWLDLARPFVRSLGICFALAIVAVAPACSTLSRYNFLQPGRDWTTRSGQLQYRNLRSTVVGDVVVRFSKRGDFELTYSKGPGVNLLVIQQDDRYARVKGPLTRLSWSGAPDRAPRQLRGWLGLREKLLKAQDRSSLKVENGQESFSFKF